MMPIQILLFFAISAVGVLAGSNCPPRVDIYPCICVNSKLNGRRQSHTTIVCQGLAKTDELSAILPILKDLEVDKFIMYDSFWGASQELGASGVRQSVLPNDWLTLTTIKEIEIFDSTLSACFACGWTFTCRNTITTSFKVMNSSSSDKICTLCDGVRNNRLPWIGCMTNLENFQLSHGGLKSLTRDFFPLNLEKLKSLDLSYNQISKIEPYMFQNIPNLKFLDLSHNAIENISQIFASIRIKTKIEYLDLSYNAIKIIPSDLISIMPKIKSFNFAYNQITNLVHSDWRITDDSVLHTIDLKGNLIRCDCNIRWLNSTFSVGVHILGKCASPDDYKESRIRSASRNLILRCNARGEIGSKKKKNS